ncbi:MAG: putative manganese transporter [Eubacteriales bacterium]|nr:putative manganese transporter [Eubacteriales bacterium]
MLEVWAESITDIVKTIPILFLVYLVISWMETRMDSVTRIVTSAEPVGPIIGALIGAIPQCGFSMGCSVLYSRGFLAPATLIAVYLSTSDEAIPVLLAGGAGWQTVVFLLVVKIVIAIVAGYVFYFLWFRKRWDPDQWPDDEMDMEEVNAGCSCCNSRTLVGAALSRTVNTTVFLVATMLILNTVIYLISEDTLASILLGGSIFQPVLCALIGLIPGCAVSVLLVELLTAGTISLGSAIAGLSAGAGFGFVLLLQQSKDRKAAWQIIGCTYVAAVVAGILVDLIF